MRRHIFVVLFASVLASCGGDECPAGFFELAGTCYDLSNDPYNCGGFNNACPSGQICQDGRCVISCPEGSTQCGGVCRDISSDDYNCGMCGVLCPVGHICVEGSCTPDCPEGYSDCSGICKNLDNDPSHCGACDSACAAGEVCSMGTCTFTCPGGYTDCSGACADLPTDHSHCGSCDNACLGGQVCVAGSCEVSCYSGLTLCSGACVDLMRDPDNCGSCGSPCGTGEVCYDGSCLTSCPGGFTDCTGSCRDLDSDRLNCGACDNACAVGEVCNTGTCEVTCPTYLVNCSGTCTDLSYDPRHCGACGNACARDEGCVDGSCVAVDIVWDPTLFPIAITGTAGGWSNICFDGAYDVLVAGQYSRSVWRVARTDGSVTTVSTTVGTGEALVSIAYDGPSNKIYVGHCCSGDIYEVDPITGSSSTLVSTLGSSINALQIAPTTFGSYGGQLIACTQNGYVLAIDLSSPTTPTTVHSGLSGISDCEFASDGTLYLVASSTVRSVGATGTPATVATGFSAADGVAVDEGRGVLYVGDSNTDQLYSVTISGGTRTTIGPYDFDSGYYPSGLLYDGVGTIIFATGESSLTLRAIPAP